MKKIPTIFIRDPENPKLVLNQVNPGCEWVFSDDVGIAHQKLDGTCCKIDASGFWKRREVKKGKPIPDGFVEEEYDRNTGKRFGWIKVNPDDKGDRWHMEALADLDLKDEKCYGTYELIGKKIQGNPERVVGHLLVKHSETLIYHDFSILNYDRIRFYLEDLDIEGIVWHHYADGRMAKIKKRDFGLSRAIAK